MTIIAKRIKMYGNSYIIILDKLDRERYNLEQGDIIELDIVNIIKKQKSSRRKNNFILDE